MSKRGYITRYLSLMKRIKARPYSTYEELRDFMEREIEFLQMQDDTLTIGFSKRTLQRDLREIRNLFGIDIEYSKSEKGYYISNVEGENMNLQRQLEAFDLFNSLNMAKDLQLNVFLEKRRPQGTEHLFGLLHAIKNRLQIKFTYHKFWEEGPTQREVYPYALKEFKNRWYLLAKERYDTVVKTYGLDRIRDLEITTHTFQYPADYSAEEQFRYCFGIIAPNDLEPQEVILSFTHGQGKYIKSLPLHHTQKVLTDNQNELKISLRIFITFDFVLELLSYGDTVKVLQPQLLANEIKQKHENAYKQYDQT
jgi:proteasome accessory factor B